MKSSEKFEQPQPVETSNPAALELKANLNPVQKDYLERLKAKLNKILGNKTAEQLGQEGDLETLKKYNAVLDEILEFLRNKKIPWTVRQLQPGEAEVYEKKAFNIDQVISVIAKFENVATSEIFCIRETRTADNIMVVSDFKIKGQDNIEYDFVASSRFKNGSGAMDTYISKIYFDQNGQADSGSIIAKHEHGKWIPSA